MKKWVSKLIEQFDFEWAGQEGNAPSISPTDISEERATILFILDTFNKHLLEVQGHPVRRVRETLDEFAKELIKVESTEKVLFRFRQFFSAYRIDECAFYQKTFEDFRTIIWDFVDQLAEDISQEQKEDLEVRTRLDELKEAVESNSIESLKNNSRRFIDCYVEKQFKKDKRRSTRMKTIQQNLNVVKKQLGDAQHSLRTDHLTQAFNRKTFDEYAARYISLNQISQQPISLLFIDIDHFKKINDTFGHDIGDFVLKELVKTLKSVFAREPDLVARIGGEEFAVLLPDFQLEHARKKAEELLQRVRAERFVQDQSEIRFTVSIGVAQLAGGENLSEWLKRADLALYQSKNSGRNKATLAPTPFMRAA